MSKVQVSLLTLTPKYDAEIDLVVATISFKTTMSIFFMKYDVT